MGESTELISLRDGGMVPAVTLGPILISLRELLEKQGVAGVIACYELRELCRNPRHELFGDSGQLLQQFSLLDRDRQVHDVTRHVVLSAVVGEDLEMVLQSPLAAMDARSAAEKTDA